MIKTQTILTVIEMLIVVREKLCLENIKTHDECNSRSLTCSMFTISENVQLGSCPNSISKPPKQHIAPLNFEGISIY